MTVIDRPPLQDNLTESDARTRAALLSNLSYEVSLVLSDDPHAATFQSATTIVFDAAHEGSETFINIAARSIDECTLNGKRLTAAQHGFNGNVLWLRGLRAGANRLSVIAQCEYQHTGVGLHRLRDPFRLLPIKPNWTPRLNRAKPTTACTYPPKNHKCRRFMTPALADIRTSGLLTHGMQIFTAHQLFQTLEVFAFGGAYL